MNNTVLVIGAILCAVVVLLFPLARAHAQPVPRMTAQDLALRLDTHEPLLLIDVRMPPEWDDGVIAGVLPLPLDRLESEIAAIKARLAERPESGVVLICRSGARATRAAVVLAKAGVAKLAVLDGGMLAWKAAGLPTTAVAR